MLPSIEAGIAVTADRCAAATGGGQVCIVGPEVWAIGVAVEDSFGVGRVVGADTCARCVPPGVIEEFAG